VSKIGSENILVATKNTDFLFRKTWLRDKCNIAQEDVGIMVVVKYKLALF